MAILPSELKIYQSTTVNDISTNGGRLSSNEVVSGVNNALIPALSETERLAGVTRKRKFFLKIANDADEVGSNGKLWLDQITPLDGKLTLFQSATPLRDTQGDLTGSERKYGVGELNADIAIAATSLVVNAETGAGAELVFQAGDTIRISDGTNAEFATIDTGGVSWASDQATITLTAGTAYGYASATPTVVSSVVEQATIATSTDNWVETSTSGTFDETTYPIINDNISTIEETWTLTFSDATNFSVSGDTVGSVGSGTTGGDFSPNNADFSKPYFTLTAAGFAGTWAVGETIVFQTHPAVISVWMELISPAAAAGGNDTSGIGINVETA